MMIRFFMWMCALSVALLLVACGGDDESSDSGSGSISVASLQVTPAQGSVPVTLSLQYAAQATMSDGSVQDVTSQSGAQWRTSDNAIATITESGLVTGIAPGRVTVTVAISGADGVPIEAVSHLEVTAAQTIALQVTPPTSMLAPGLARQLTATIQLSDGTTQDVTQDTHWDTSDRGIATVEDGVVTGLGMGTVRVTASGTFNGKPLTGSAQLTVSAATVTALQVTPAATMTAAGLVIPFTATAVLSDGTSQQVTSMVSWTSSNTDVATVNNEQNKWGQAKGINPGTSTITAAGTFNSSIVKGNALLTVNNSTVTSLQLTPPNPRVPVGLPQQLVATAVLSDGASQPALDVSWFSDDPTTATITPSGVATGVNAGSAALHASITTNGQVISNNSQLTVTDATVDSLLVTPTKGAVPIGLTQQYDATALMSDGTSLPMTNSASWVSDSLDIATVASGLATGISAGDARITATAIVNGKSVSGNAALAVTGADVTDFDVSPGVETVPVGLSKPFTVTARMSDGTSQDVTSSGIASWSSDKISVATVNSATGVATGVAPGAAYITAAGAVNGVLLSDSASLEVKQNCDPSGAGANPVTDPNGKIFTRPLLACEADALGVPYTETFPENGHTYVVMTWPEASAYCTNMGGDYYLPSQAELSDLVYEHFGNMEVRFNWPTQLGYWSTDSRGAGRHNAVNLGDGALYDNPDDGYGFVSCVWSPPPPTPTITSLDVTPPSTSIAVGQSQQFTAVATLSDGNTQNVTSSAIWGSSDSAIAFVNGTGLATGAAEGLAVITAATQDDVHSDDAQLAVTLPGPNFDLGCIMGRVTDSTGKMWTCPMVDSEADKYGLIYSGSVTNVNSGLTYILPDWSQSSNNCSKLGGGYRLPSIDEFNIFYAEYGDMKYYAGWPNYQGFWSSSHHSGSKYYYYDLANGYTYFDDGGRTNHMSCVRVAPPGAVMIGLKIVPVPASVALGHTLQFFAAALLSDGSYKDVSDSVYWSSNSTNIASIDRVTGLALGIAEGTATIIAEMQDGSLPHATRPLMVSSSLPNFDLGCTTGMVTDAGGKVWTCPLTYDEAVLFDIPFDDEYQENGKWYVMMSWQNASSYCANLGGGYYLPSKDELRGLWNEFGNMEIFAGWPTAKWYWTSTATSDTYYNIVRLSDGYINSDIDFKTHYVSCVRTGP